MGKNYATEEQKLYAGILDKGMKVGLLMLLVTFGLYMGGVMKPQVPRAEISRYWSLPVSQYLEETGIHTGWAWLGSLGKGDMVNFLGIAFLAGVTIICYLAIVPTLMRKKDTPYVVLALLEVAVLVLAASGLLKSGGH